VLARCVDDDELGRDPSRLGEEALALRRLEVTSRSGR